MSRLAADAIRGKGARAALREKKRWEAVDRQIAALAAGRGRAPIHAFTNDPNECDCAGCLPGGER